METVHYYEVSCWVDMEEPKAAMNTGGHDDFWKRFRVPWRGSKSCLRWGCSEIRVGGGFLGVEDWPERLLGIDGGERHRARCCCVDVFLRCSYSCACYGTLVFVYNAAFLNRISSSLFRSQHSAVYVAFGWAARSMTIVLHHGRAPAFPSFISMVDLNGRCCDPDPVHAKQYGCCYSEASDGSLSVISHFRNTSTADSGLLLLQSGSGTAGRSASVPSCHAHACRPDPASSMHESFCMGLIGLVFSH